MFNIFYDININLIKKIKINNNNYIYNYLIFY